MGAVIIVIGFNYWWGWKTKRTEYVIDESTLGGDLREAHLGLRRFMRMLQDLLDEEGLPIDVRIGVTSNSILKQGIRGLGAHVPEWILTEARKRYYEELPG